MYLANGTDSGIPMCLLQIRLPPVQPAHQPHSRPHALHLSVLLHNGRLDTDHRVLQHQSVRGRDRAWGSNRRELHARWPRFHSLKQPGSCQYWCQFGKDGNLCLTRDFILRNTYTIFFSPLSWRTFFAQNRTRWQWSYSWPKYSYFPLFFSYIHIIAGWHSLALDRLYCTYIFDAPNINLEDTFRWNSGSSLTHCPLTDRVEYTSPS